jgi:DNA-binding HxlR family transcriptional regulator
MTRPFLYDGGVLGNDYADQTCSAARALEVVGERWTLLLLRDLFLGIDRFDALVASLGVTRTVLTRRLAHLVEHGVVEKRRYSERPERFSYHPTPKGLELMGVVALLMQWGDRHYPHPAGPPRFLLHRGCGGAVDDHLSCERCGARLRTEDIDAPLNPAVVG